MEHNMKHQMGQPKSSEPNLTQDKVPMKAMVHSGPNHHTDMDTEQLANVVLAYAMTIHKSQGCEYPGVIIALLPEHYIMLQRNLFYTAVTRARTACVVVGDENIMRRAVTNSEIAKRYTALGWFLKNPAPVVSPDMLVEEPEEVDVVEVETDDEDEEEVDAEELIHQLAF